MGNDYHIYIHGQNNGFGNNKRPSKTNTQPFFKQVNSKSQPNYQEQTSPWQVAKATRVVTGLSTGKVGILQTASKFIPAVAIAYAIVKVVDKAITTISDFNTRETGDYSFKMSYNNMKSSMGVALNPIKGILDYTKSSQEMRIENDKRQQAIQLLGDNSLNSIHNNGV